MHTLYIFITIMKKIKIFILLTLAFNFCIAQNRNSIWCFGDSAGMDFSIPNNPTVFASGMDGSGNCVAMADTNGSLLFYAYDNAAITVTYIRDANHNLMPNANLIPSNGYYNGMVIIPKPNSSQEYYLFYHGNYSNVQTFFYSIIDMNLNNGMGDLSQKNIQIQAINFSDCMTAVQHGNGRDWWVIDKYYIFPFTHHNRFFAYLIKPDTIMPAIIQDFNDMNDGAFQKICWHPSYNKFMLISVVGYMAEFDFDRCTGSITLNRIIFPEQLSNYNRIFWDGAYSPNGNVFYVGRSSYGGNFGIYNYLLQYDLTVTNIPASCDTLDFISFPPADNGAVRLAPDGKIYYTQAYIPTNALNYPYADTMRNYINENLGVVNNPDVVGAGCNFAPFSFHLGGKRTYWGLPNNPNYSLGRLMGSPCDTLHWTNLTPALSKGEGKLYATYVAAWEKLFINAQNLNGKNVTITIYDGRGSAIINYELKIINGYATVDVVCSGWSDGLYVVHLQTEKEVLSKKFVKE